MNQSELNVEDADVNESKSIQQTYNTSANYDIESLPFNFKEEDATWGKYGYTTLPLGIRRAKDTGQFLFNRQTKYKAIFKDGKYQDLVGRAYALYPNEVVDEIVHNAADKQDFEIRRVHSSHNNKARYWEIISKRFDAIEIKDSFERNDTVAVGAIIRNGVGVPLALGADLFTYRLSCLNGAVARGKDIGSIAIRHVGEIEKLADRFADGLEHIFEQSAKLCEYYKQAVHIKINQRIAEKLAKAIPEKYLPGFIEVETLNNGELDVTLTDRSADLWRTFNDTTKALWHSGTAGFSTVRTNELYLHRILVSEVNRSHES
jgi:hypothetical protein